MPTISKVNSAKNIRASIRYARDSKDKQGRSKLHDEIGINCDPKSAEHSFESTNFAYQWSSRKNIQLKKCVLGFGPLNNKTLSAQEAHIYTKRLLAKYNRQLGGGWRIVAYAHHDHSESYHYHVLIDNCNMRTGKKLTTVYNDVKKLRNLNDETSRSFGIQPVKKQRLVAKDIPEIKGQEKAQKRNNPRYSYQDHVRTILSRAMIKSQNFDAFQAYLHHNDMYLRSNFFTKAKNGTVEIPSINPQGKRNHDKSGNPTWRRVKTNRLGMAFDKKAILKQLSQPFNKRREEFTLIYGHYTKVPNSVDLSSTMPSPFMKTSTTKEKTSNKYLNRSIIRNNFKNKGEIKSERQLKLIRTIKELNRNFEAEKPISKRSEQSFVESSSKINKKERQIEKAKRAVKRPIESIRRPEENTSIESSIRRSERAVERAKQQARTASTNQERKSGSSRKKQSSSGREQQASPGQQAIKLTYRNLRITKNYQTQYDDDDQKLLPREEQRNLSRQKQESQQNVGWLQRCQQAFRSIRETEWSRVRRNLSKLGGTFNRIRETLKDNGKYINGIIQNVEKRYKVSRHRNKYDQRKERYPEHQKNNPRLSRIYGTLDNHDIDFITSQHKNDTTQLNEINNCQSHISSKIKPAQDKLNSLLLDQDSVEFKYDNVHHQLSKYYQRKKKIKSNQIWQQFPEDKPKKDIKRKHLHHRHNPHMR